MSLLPKTTCDLDRIDLQILPPSDLVAGLMELPMVAAAKRNGELITDLETDRPGLREAQVMRIGWLSPAYQTRLGGHEFQVRLVAQALRLGNGELALIDFVRRQRRQRCVVFPCSCLILAKQFSHRARRTAVRSNATAAGSVSYRRGVNRRATESVDLQLRA